MKFFARQHVYIGTAAVMLLNITAAPLQAVVKTWDPVGGSFNWNSNSNWDPDGIPGDNDDVVIVGTGSFLSLTADTATVNSVDLSGALLQTNGFKLNVDNAGAGLLTVAGIPGGAGGTLALFPAAPHSMRVDNAVIGDGGVISLSNNAIGNVDGALTIHAGGVLRTSNNGTIQFFSTQAGAELINDGTIEADGNISSLEPVVSATFDLDGTTGNGVVNVTSGSRFFVNGAIADAFNGTMNIGEGGADAQLNMTLAWTNAGGAVNPGLVNLDAGELSGGTVTNEGEIRGHGSITTESLDNNGTISAVGGTLVIDTVQLPQIDGSNETGILNAVDGDLEVHLGMVFGGASFAGTINVGPGHELRLPNLSLILTRGAEVNLTGGAVVGGALSFLPSDVRPTIHVMTGPESRIESGNINTSFFGDEDVILDSDLRLIGVAQVVASAAFTGSGTLIIDQAGELLFQSSDATIDTNVRNEGVAAVFQNLAAQITLGAHYTQTASATLRIDIGGIVSGTQYDLFAVGGIADLAGTLDVRLLSPFSPNLGDSFEILTASGGVNGMFASTLFPDLGALLAMDVFYDTNSVTLAVVPALPGDFDVDGDVDGFDFLGWQRGESPNPLSQSDLADWEANYGMVAPLSATSAAVPEPATSVLALAALCLAMSRRRIVAR